MKNLFWVKKMWLGNFFGSIFFGSKKIWVKTNVDQKYFLGGSKKIWVGNLFGRKDFFLNLGQKFFWVKKNWI